MRGNTVCILLAVLIAFEISIAGYLFLAVSSPSNGVLSVKEENAASPPCIVKSGKVTVGGTSMLPLVKPGETVTALFGYHACHPVERDDVVLYHYAGDKNPLIKSVKAGPGDRWSLEERDGYFLIFVNGKVLENSAGEEYEIPDTNRILPLYVKDYPVIPQNAYLILGDNPEGSLDSSRFGLIGGEDLLGKVIGTLDH
jgi:signal peptidase I